MARESSTRVGSGIQVLLEEGDFVGLRGNNAVIANFEDINSCLGLVATSGLSVTATASPISTSGMPKRRKLLIQNLGAGNLFIGGSDVTTANGIRIGSGELRELDVLSFGTIWGVSASTSDVRILEMR